MNSGWWFPYCWCCGTFDRNARSMPRRARLSSPRHATRGRGSRAASRGSNPRSATERTVNSLAKTARHHGPAASAVRGGGTGGHQGPAAYGVAIWRRRRVFMTTFGATRRMACSRRCSVATSSQTSRVARGRPRLCQRLRRKVRASSSVDCTPASLKLSWPNCACRWDLWI